MAPRTAALDTFHLDSGGGGRCYETGKQQQFSFIL